jgi:isoleucyl-tRNA synthetase
MFRAVKTDVKFPKQEEAILKFWKDNDIYKKSLLLRQGSKPFVFFEGPPTANGLPHPGHCLTRAIKDLFPRYRTMRGYWCNRKAGWDTHGLPVEVEVCKELGIHSKDEIENYGVEPFIAKCQQSVWRYMQEWERVTERLGFWIDLSEAYVTYHQSYVESVWWSLKNLFDRGLLYRGHKIVWWWAQGGTALSSGEVGQGYREVADPSVYVRFPLVDQPNTSLVVWTTTPWTLPSNQFAAVHQGIQYAYCTDPESKDTLIVAADLVKTLGEKIKRELTVEKTVPGSQLVGLRYVPPFDYYHKTMGSLTSELLGGGQQHTQWRVVHADFVTIDSGTGIVHLAPAFGEVDYEVLIEQRERFVQDQGPELICAVGPDGKFNADAADYQGVWVKDADRPISRALRERGLLWHQEQYVHDYPFCWRASQDPLIQYPRESWFIRTTAFRDAMLENNSKIGWLPEHIGPGRFGNFLESNVDWALSRERYWGTPLPVWVCQSTGKMESIGSYQELLSKPGIDGTDVWAKAKAAKAFAAL